MREPWLNASWIYPWNLTWIPKMAIFKKSHLFQTIILGIHVSFRGCNSISGNILCMDSALSSVSRVPATVIREVASHSFTTFIYTRDTRPPYSTMDCYFGPKVAQDIQSVMSWKIMPPCHANINMPNQAIEYPCEWSTHCQDSKGWQNGSRLRGSRSIKWI